MRVLVTGGAGYVGAASVEGLLAAGHAVVVLDDLSTGHRGAVPRGAAFVEGTYTDADAVSEILADQAIEAVLHCGARSLVGESIARPELYHAENVVGGGALLDACRAAGVTRFVFSSTAAVYGIPEAVPIEEDAAMRPINPYGETKLRFEDLLRDAATNGIRSVTLRYFNVAGASAGVGEVHDPETHLIPNLLAAAGGGPPLTIFGTDYPTPDGTAIRDYIHVLDLATAHLAALEATAPGDPRMATPLVCNLGSAAGFSVREVVAAAERVVGHPIPQSDGPRRAGDPPVLVASNARAERVLGWWPARSTLEEMIGSAWAWRRAHPGGYPAVI
jgi:UDP-glucose 4-epimerase